MGLFNQKSREDSADTAQGGAATGPAAARPVAQSTRQVQSTPAQGENAVANIGKSISIKGDLTGNEDMVIEGTVEGKVDLPNNQLTVGANGNVRAEISAKSVVVVGRVSGNVNGTERVEIQGTGVVEGDVRAPHLIVAEGAVLNGSIQMTKKAGAAESPPPTSTTGATTGAATSAKTSAKTSEVRRAG